MNIVAFIAGLLWLGEGLFPGKPDQERYALYGEYCEAERSEGMLTSIQNIQAQKNIKESNTAYPLLSCMIYRYSFSPVVSLRLINFIAHLLICIFILKFYENFGLFREGLWAAMLVGILPSFYAFDMIIMRDLLIVFSFAALFLSCSYIPSSLRFSLVLVLIGLSLVFLRIHLLPSAVLAIFYLAISRQWKSRFLPYGLFIGSVLLGTFLSSVSFPYNQVNIYFNSYDYFLNSILLFLEKAPIELLGFSFLLPGKTLGMPIEKILVNRLLIFDSLIVPIAFLLLLLATTRKRKGEVEGIVLFPMVIYYMTYFSLEYGSGRHLPYSFRVSLPFHFLMAASLPYLWFKFVKKKA